MSHLLAILAGSALAASFPLADLSLLAWFAFIPLFAAIDRTGPGKAFMLSYVSGLVFFAVTIHWLTCVTIPGYLFLVTYLALYFGMFGILVSVIARRAEYSDRRSSPQSFGEPADVLVTGSRYLFTDITLAFSWALLEYLRSNLFTGFGWALLGYSQYRNLPLIQIADIAGVHGLSFVIMFFNAALFRMIFRGGTLRPAHGAAAVSIVVFMLAYGGLRLNQFEQGETVRVSVIQGDISLSESWDAASADSVLAGYAGLTYAAAKEDADLIVWPETAVPGYLDEDMMASHISPLAKRAGKPLLIGGVTYEAKGGDVLYYNSAALVSPSGKITAYYDKIHLVPLGEYIPFERYFGWLRRYIPEGFCELSAGKDMGPLALNGGGPCLPPFGVLICYEDIFPELSRRWVQRGARFLVNITNDIWFGEGAEQWQHLQASVFRAVENRIPVIRAANNGISCIIDAKGEIRCVVRDKNGSSYGSGFATNYIF